MMFEEEKTLESRYLSAQVEITEKNGRFRAGQNQNDIDNEQKSEEIVVLVGPARHQHIEGIEREHATHQILFRIKNS